MPIERQKIDSYLATIVGAAAVAGTNLPGVEGIEGTAPNGSPICSVCDSTKANDTSPYFGAEKSLMKFPFLDDISAEF